MYKNTRRLRWIGCAAALVGATAVTSSSYAFDQRLAYSACLVDLGGNDNYKDGGNDLTAGSLSVACPVLGTTDLPHASMSTIHLYYDDLNTTYAVSAMRCVAYQNATGGNCGDLVNSAFGGTGSSYLVVPNTPASFAAHWNYGHFAYLTVFLPPKVAGARSRIKGYWMSN